MKHLFKVILSLALACLPIFPIYFIEPIREGTDVNVYGFWAEIYIQFFFFLVGLVFYFVSWKFVDKILK